MLYAKYKRSDKPVCLISVAIIGCLVDRGSMTSGTCHIVGKWTILNIILRKQNKTLQLIFKWSNTGGRHCGGYGLFLSWVAS